MGAATVSDIRLKRSNQHNGLVTAIGRGAASAYMPLYPATGTAQMYVPAAVRK